MIVTAAGSRSLVVSAVVAIFVWNGRRKSCRRLEGLAVSHDSGLGDILGIYGNNGKENETTIPGYIGFRGLGVSAWQQIILVESWQ